MLCTMDFSMQSWSALISAVRKAWIVFAALVSSVLLLIGLAQNAYADGISIRSVDLEIVDEGYLLNADFDIELTPKLQDAVSHGVPLDFVLTFDLWRPRSWWFDETIIHFQEHRKISFVAVTRMYRLNIGSAYETFPNLKEALKALAHVHAVPAAEKQGLMKGQRYEASISLGLDPSLLPKPLQIEGLSTGEWQLSSPIHRFTVNPS
jgi:Domain of unknown function (DUF4390)